MQRRRNKAVLLAAAALAVLIATAAGVLLVPRPRTAAVFYAAASGAGSACTETAPCKVATWLQTPAYTVPGAGLVLEDGTYRGGDSRLDIPPTFAGTAAQPITIRARHEGQVLLDGQGTRPININGTWGVIWGIDVTNGDNHTIRFQPSSSHWKVQRFVSYDTTPPIGDGQVLLAGTKNLVEDGVIFGEARKALVAAQSGGTGNTARRIWARWESNPHQSSNPTNAAEVGYTQDNILFENILSTWDLRPGGRTTSPEGVWQLFATRNSKLVGSIAYVQASDAFQANKIMFGLNDGGSHAQQGHYHNTQNLLFQHNVMFISPSHPNFANVRACHFSEDTDAGGASPDGTGNIIDSIVCVGGLAASFTAGTWDVPTNVESGTSLAAAIGGGNSLWTESHAAPGICKRYVDGTLTTTPLWPWPMNQRAKDRMTAAGRTPVDITATMEALFGPIPAACRTGGGGDTTAPTVRLTAPHAGATVSGAAVALEAEAHDAVGVVGVQFLLDGAPLQAQDASAPYGVTWDVSAVPPGAYRLSASARDAAGNLGSAEEVAVTVAGAVPPIPPEESGPLTLVCTGTLDAVPGTLRLTCTQPPPP